MQDEIPSTDKVDAKNLDAIKVAADIRLREEELALKREELLYKVENDKQQRKANLVPIITALSAAIITLLGTSIANIIQGKAAQELEDRKFQSQLILK